MSMIGIMQWPLKVVISSLTIVCVAALAILRLKEPDNPDLLEFSPILALPMFLDGRYLALCIRFPRLRYHPLMGLSAKEVR